MNLRSRCEPTGRIMSAGCENSRTTTTKVMKMTEMIDSSDVLVSAAMFFSSASGLALWLARGTLAMPLLLALHLGVVMALFLTLPYGKFAHGIFRGAALLKWSIERRQPDRLKLGAD